MKLQLKNKWYISLIVHCLGGRRSLGLIRIVGDMNNNKVKELVVVLVNWGMKHTQ